MIDFLKKTSLTCLLAGTALQAGVILNYDATLPTDPVLQTFDSATAADDTWGASRDVKKGRNLTQTFQLNADLTMDKILLAYSNGNTSSDRTFNISIVEVDDIAASPFVETGTEVFNVQVTTDHTSIMSDALGTAYLLEFDLTGADEVTLAARNTGTQGYAFRLLDDGTTQTVFKWKGEGSNTYDGGVFYQDGASGLEPSGSRDWSLVIDGTTTAIPEPAAALLFVLSGGLILLRRRN